MSYDPIDPVNNTNGIDPYDPSNYKMPDPQNTEAKDPTLAGFTESMHMSPEQVKKFMNQLIDTMTSRMKEDTQHAVDAIKEATKEAQQQ